MKYLVKDEKLELKYVPGKGSWTYHLQIPNTRNIRGKWGDIKVSGSIDGYKIENRNLAPIKGGDKILSVNSTIRNVIKKTGGDLVTVTIFLVERKEQITRNKILDAFKDADVMGNFQDLSKTEQNEIIEDILSQATDEKQIKRLVSFIDQWSM